MDPDVLSVVFPRTGRFVLDLPGRELHVRPPDFVVRDATTPLRDQPYADRDPGAPLVIRAHRSRLGLRASVVDRLVGVPLPGDRGIGAVLRTYVIGLDGRLDECHPADTTRLASITLDLLTATLAHHAGGATAGSREDQRLMRRRIDDFIRQHLTDPELCPELVAAEHRISLRYLYKLFEDEKLSVAATIRRRRLEGGRADLAAPALRTRSIHAIATRWGFSDATRFSHAFRQAYGMSPSDFRTLTTLTHS